MKIWSFVKRLLFLVLAFLILNIEQIPVIFISSKDPVVIVLLILSMLMITAGALYLGKVLGLLEGFKNLKDAGSWKLIGLTFLATYVIKFIGGIVLGLEGQTNTNNQEALQNANMNPLVLIVFAVIVAPIVEELIFRGILMAKVFNPNSLIGMVVSALLFGWVHGPTNIGSWIIYAGMGFGLAYLYHRTHKLEHTIALHMINNYIGVIFMLLAQVLVHFLN